MPIETPIRPAAEPFPNYNRVNQVRDVLNEKTGGADKDLGAMSRVTPSHVKRWDPATAANLANLEANMAARPAPAAWVLVLHPWPISVNGGRLMRETAPPAGFELMRDGKLTLHRVRVQGMGETKEFEQEGIGLLQIPWYEPDLKPEENGSHTALPIYPIEQAAQYAREGNSNALWGPGVLIYDGDLSPEEMWNDNVEVPVFDILGKPIVRQETVRTTQRGSLIPVDRTVEVPVKGKFREVFQEIENQRIVAYLHIVNEAMEQFAAAEGKEKKWFVTRNIRLMAQVLFKRNRIKALPPWAIETNLTSPTPDPQLQKCISCGLAQDGELKVCKCGWPFDPLGAYMDGLIAFEHISISVLSIEKLEQAYKLKAERDKAKEKLEAKFAKKS